MKVLSCGIEDAPTQSEDQEPAPERYLYLGAFLYDIHTNGEDFKNVHYLK